MALGIFIINTALSSFNKLKVAARLKQMLERIHGYMKGKYGICFRKQLFSGGYYRCTFFLSRTF